MKNNTKTRIVANLLLLLMIGATQVWSTPWTNSLYTDKKGKRVGDVVTVLVVEAANASNDTRTETDKQNELELGSEGGSGLLDWIPGLGVSGNSRVQYDGKGKTARKGQLTATVTARIMQVMENGNLLIEGSKVVTLNEEDEIIQVSGMIRSDDINADNTVLSHKIADAVIRYTGKGVNADAQKPGLITRFFNWLL